MAELSLADQQQQYGNSLILYKGKPHKVKQIADTVRLLDLATQRIKYADFSLKDFAPPFFRFGYVNVEETVIYVQRLPLRIMQVGVNDNNCKFAWNYGDRNRNREEAFRKVAAFECPEVLDMLVGNYPNLKTAYKKAMEHAGSYAFDKQFSVNFNGEIFYKTKSVGFIHEDDKIIFNKNCEHLDLLLGDAYEKALRDA